MSNLSSLQASLVRINVEISNTHGPDDLRPTKQQIARYNAKIDALTTERRSIQAAIATLTTGEVREFANDIANRESAAMWKFMQQRQLDGVLSSCGR